MKKSITGGTFGSDPTEYVADGYGATLNKSTNLYEVASANFAEMTIGGTTTQYSDQMQFLTALRNAENEAISVKLLSDIEVPGEVPVAAGQTVDFDLNGFTLSTTTQPGNASRHYYAIMNNGAFTLTDSSEAGTGTIIARGIQNNATGTMTVESGTIVSCDANGGASIWNYGDLTVNGGTFKTRYEGADNGAGCLNNDKGTAHITGGTFTSVNRRVYALASTGSLDITPAEGKEITVSGAHGGLAVDSGTAVVNGGTYSSSEYYGLYVSNDGAGLDPMKAAVTVNGGTFSGPKFAVWVGSDINDSVNSTIEIKGGTFNQPLNAQENTRPGAIVVSGGTFKAPVKAEFVASGYVATHNQETDEYVVSQVTNDTKIQITDKDGNTVDAVGTMSDALSEVAETGGTLTLAGDMARSTEAITISTSAAGSAPVILELNGNTLGAKSITVDNNAECVISDKTKSGSIAVSADGSAVEVSGTLTVDGAAIVNSAGSGISVKPGATLNVAGGSLEAQAPVAALSLRTRAVAEQYGIVAAGEEGNPATVNISGGKVSGATAAVSFNENVATNITGGTFSSSVADYLNNGYTQRAYNNDTEYDVVQTDGTNAAYSVERYKVNTDDPSTWTSPDAESGQAFAGWYEDSAFATPYLGTTGQAYAKFVNISDIITFKGGSLRMDTDPAATTNLRFGYNVTMPEGLNFVDAGWMASGIDFAGNSVAEYVSATNKIVSDMGVIETNLLIVNLKPSAQYTQIWTSAMQVTYKTDDGTLVKASEQKTQERSVVAVANKIAVSNTATAQEKTYAEAILSAAKAN